MSERRHTPARILVNVILALFSLSCIFPLVWIGYTSLKTLPQYNLSVIAPTLHPTVANYVAILKAARFGMYFTNSLIVSVGALVLVLAIAFVTGYFLSRFSFRGRRLLSSYFLLGMVIPSYGWLLPVYIQFRLMGVLDHRITLIIPYVAFGLPIAVFLIESFVKGVPHELEEAAMMEGCGTWRSLFWIILPLCMPVLVTVLILTFNGSWNEFPFALVLINRQELVTLPVALTMFQGAYTTNYPQLMAALAISVIPVVALYLAFSGRIIQGMTAGAIKG